MAGLNVVGRSLIGFLIGGMAIHLFKKRPFGGVFYMLELLVTQTVAVFVDVGYLYRAGTMALTGTSKDRKDTLLDYEIFLTAIKAFAANISRCDRLLRVYWYDGAPPATNKNVEHAFIALLDDVKLRLGHLNADNEQKGVDALLIADTIELARNRAINAAVVLTGDEDIRPCFPIIQSMGVRVHLLGMKPASTQSTYLREEADTISEWDVPVLKTFVKSVVPQKLQYVPPVDPGLNQDQTLIAKAINEVILGSVLLHQKQQFARFFIVHKDFEMPNQFDRQLLFHASHKLGRKLESSERKWMRSRFKHTLIHAS